MSNANEPASPVSRDEMNTSGSAHGLTKREAMAMQILAGIDNKPWHPDAEDAKQFARMAVDYADALLAELARKEG